MSSTPLETLSPFGSRSVIMHVLRGALGFALVAIALIYGANLGWWTILPIAGALVLFRGCPMCWTVGLIETVARRFKKSGPAEPNQACVDGSCSIDSSAKDR